MAERVIRINTCSDCPWLCRFFDTTVKPTTQRWICGSDDLDFDMPVDPDDEPPEGCPLPKEQV
jgi:hypothetical protein